MDKRDDGGPAFPGEQGQTPDGLWNQTFNPGMSLRDWFATHAPAPTKGQIDGEYALDRGRNPYNEPGKPRLRSSSEIIADLAYEYADSMLAARAKGGKT